MVQAEVEGALDAELRAAAKSVRDARRAIVVYYVLFGCLMIAGPHVASLPAAGGGLTADDKAWVCGLGVLLCVPLLLLAAAQSRMLDVVERLAAHRLAGAD